ncbi:hypothetical protein BW731_00630 [Vagococcus martis]|uniref:Lipoprotein n=1 Tax=Vagococcus martis TaxID=1768210 RepID=A0A1V4DE96_9ENTE|nr:hypothetical protein [Vagococcus martis]OPF86807.1 hypothetical protein BW731_00630 [Vagococcus martis]
MKKRKLLNILIVGLILVSGCGKTLSNDKNEEQDSSSYNEKNSPKMIEKEEENSETIYEHFTEDLTDEIWIEVESDESGTINQESRISGFLITNDTSYKSELYKGFEHYSSDEKGYIWTDLARPINNRFDTRPTLMKAYLYYNEGVLNQKLYKAFIDREASFIERDNEHFGTGRASYIYTEKLNFKHHLNSETKKLTQTIVLVGKDLFFDEELSNYRTVSFKIVNDAINVELTVNDETNLYLVGFRVQRDGEKDRLRYLVKFSDKKKDFVFDPLYSNEEIEIQ